MTIPLTVRRQPVTGGAFVRRISLAIGGSLKALSIRTVQLNIGLRCNLSCAHCHVQSSPRRREQMTWEIMKLSLAAASKVRAAAIDITGGAPEMHPRFRKLIEAARLMDLQVTVRTNLTILLKPEYQNLPQFFKRHRVRLVATLPSCEAAAVDQQRGVGVYRESIAAIRMLNSIGYGIDPTLPLDLIHNPLGAQLSLPQAALECEFKRELDLRFGIRFTQLFATVNMPIGRFRRELDREGKTAAYLHRLESNFNIDTVDGLMCRHQLHIGWDGTLHDCDFNHALGLRVSPDTPGHIRDFDPTTYLQRRIANAEHCFGCTAGRGSSFGGALV